MAGLVALPHANEAGMPSDFASGWARDARERCAIWSGADESGRLLRERVGIPVSLGALGAGCFASYLSACTLSTETPEPRSGWIARYAWSGGRKRRGRSALRPSDYHKVLLKRMRKVEAELHARLGEFESRAFVDTGPVVERALAVAAGLGWIGKNTCLIHPELGSFGFLAVLLTSLEVSEGAGARERVGGPENRRTFARMGWNFRIAVGSCTRCIEACPTNALIAPYQMDATRCISYLTIEHKGPIGEELMEGMGRQVFGCDICQDVCPWNQKSLEKARRGGPIAVDTELSRGRNCEPGTGLAGVAGRGGLRARVQRIAGAAGGICGDQAERGDCDGQQRADAIRAAARGLDAGSGRGIAERCAVGAQQGACECGARESLVN